MDCGRDPAEAKHDTAAREAGAAGAARGGHGNPRAGQAANERPPGFPELFAWYMTLPACSISARARMPRVR